MAGLESDADSGLTGAEAASRLSRYGPNEIGKEQPPSMWAVAPQQLRDPMNIMLIAVVAVSFVIGEVSTGVIVGAADPPQRRARHAPGAEGAGEHRRAREPAGAAGEGRARRLGRARAGGRRRSRRHRRSWRRATSSPPTAASSARRRSRRRRRP